MCLEYVVLSSSHFDLVGFFFLLAINFINLCKEPTFGLVDFFF